MTQFQPAVRTQARARVAIDGPPKAGKSMTALRLAFALSPKVAAVDTEFGSLSKYVGDSPDGEGPFKFDVVNLHTFSPAAYIDIIRSAERSPYDVLVIDSLSHAWVGEGGILDQADKSSNKNSFTKWADLTPQQRKLVDTIQASPLHVICTMRSKIDWVLEKNEYTGKMEPRKVGLAPVQREGMEYEFDLLCSVNQEHLVTVTGSRCSAMDGARMPKPGGAFFRPYVEWLTVGTPREQAPTLGSAAAVQPSTNGTAKHDDGERADSEQLARIDTLAVQVGLTAEQFAAGLKERYGVDSALDLTPAQANRIAANLEATLRNRQPQGAGA
jgi:hypothetical protein